MKQIAEYEISAKVIPGYEHQETKIINIEHDIVIIPAFCAENAIYVHAAASIRTWQSVRISLNAFPAGMRL